MLKGETFISLKKNVTNQGESGGFFIKKKIGT